ncbi:MAG: hypothetical protein LBS88_08415 [Tannerellaceae bacterium]|jgi:hypothetical protein|nr:hypothetical protein [Tannerellaceae bacterium]
MEKELNKQESLQLITDMIAQARERFQNRSGDGIILWGYVVAILALANFVLLQVLEGEQVNYSYWVWMCTIPVFVVNYIREAGKAKKAYVRNYIDSIIGYVWLAFFISNLILIASVFILAITFQDYHGGILFRLITPMIMGMTGLCLFINGKAYRFQPFVYGAILFWTGALVSALIQVVWAYSLHFLVLALCMIPGFILPGHILNRKARQDV